MKVKKAFIKSRRTETHITSEAYQFGGDDHGDAIGFQASVPLEINGTARVSQRKLMIKLCNAGIIPVTQINGLVLCFPDGNGGIEMVEDLDQFIAQLAYC